MNDYYKGWERLLKAISAGTGIESPSIDDAENMTADQQLQVAQTVALLSIAQELSALNPQNTTTRAEDGTARNGWGLPV